MRTDAPRQRRPRPAVGLTLIELVIVIVVFAGLGATMAGFYRPAIDAYLATTSRARLVADAHHAASRILRDAQTAVPNSLRAPSPQCLEMVPTTGGGRMRLNVDTVNAGSAAALPGTSITAFDVLSTSMPRAAVGDWIVIDNHNASDVYQSSPAVNRAAITSLATVAGPLGAGRIGIGPLDLPPGHSGGRFLVVPDAQKAVFYVCDGVGTTLDGNGNGPGRVLRLQGYGFNAAVPSACPSVTGADMLVGNVTRCRIVYVPGHAPTQQAGYVGIELELTRRGEVAALTLGGHVLNVP